ncbi:MAG: Rne/Rng family ribonuclease [Pseudomonadota bacterium]
MSKKMLIDATHTEETRVVVIDGQQLLDFDFESSTKKQLKGNIYLAKVTRVEPSLQAAFVDYGGNRHGFLAFSEIHPDYYQIPQADRELLEKLEQDVVERATAEPENQADEDGNGGGDLDDETADVADLARRRSRILRSYKIQEVIKRRQILLVQVVKEERGNKGAALTTYLSLAGRYCVLMPNTPRGGGISRKIANPADRRRLKTITQDLAVPQGMGLIVRTAGQERSKTEIKRDYEYLLRMWSEIRETTMQSVAPSLIYEEGDLIKRAMRDLYARDIEEVLVEGEEGYRSAKRLMQMLMPSRARQVRQFRGELPIFFTHDVEPQLDQMHTPTVRLPSGGSIVIHTTEALTAIDVNSGRSTRERHIDETAVKTNLEAADEIARQLRLRDLAGLVVIDFIDMSENRHQRQVERRIRDALKADRARIQLGKISTFGLMELSRQRLRSSLQELSSQVCPTCSGLGVVRSTESSALQILRMVQEHGIKGEVASLRVTLPTEVALYLLNQKRDMLVHLEERYTMQVVVAVDREMLPEDKKLEVLEKREVEAEGDETATTEQATRTASQPAEQPATAEPASNAASEDAEEGGTRRRRRRKRRRRSRGDETNVAETAQADEASKDSAQAEASEAQPDESADAGDGDDAAVDDAAVDDAAVGDEAGVEPIAASGVKETIAELAAPEMPDPEAVPEVPSDHVLAHGETLQEPPELEAGAQPEEAAIELVDANHVQILPDADDHGTNGVNAPGEAEAETADLSVQAGADVKAEEEINARLETDDDGTPVVGEHVPPPDADAEPKEERQGWWSRWVR